MAQFWETWQMGTPSSFWYVPSLFEWPFVFYTTGSYWFTLYCFYPNSCYDQSFFQGIMFPFNGLVVLCVFMVTNLGLTDPLAQRWRTYGYTHICQWGTKTPGYDLVCSQMFSSSCHDILDTSCRSIQFLTQLALWSFVKCLRIYPSCKLTKLTRHSFMDLRTDVWLLNMRWRTLSTACQ